MVTIKVAMANFNIHFPDSDDDLSLLTEVDNKRNEDDVEINVDMESLMNLSRDSVT